MGDENSIVITLGGIVITIILLIGLNRDLKKEWRKNEEEEQ